VPQIYSGNEDHDNRHRNYHKTNLVGVGTPLRSGMVGRVGVCGLPIFNQALLSSDWTHLFNR
jgi:hypothetical protein